MTNKREAIEPDDVYEKNEWNTGRRLRRAADTLSSSASTARRTASQIAGTAGREARTRARAAAAPGGAVDRTEERITGLLSTASAGVSVGARRVRRMLRS